MKTFFLLMKMMFRTIKLNIMQFLAIISIGSIAVTLFVGLLSNALVFETQVNSVYTNGNLADIWVTNSKYDESDYNKLKEILPSDSTIEERFYMPTMSNSHSIYLTVVKDKPTISKPFNNTEFDKDFLLIDYDLYNTDSKNYSIGNDLNISIDLSIYKFDKTLVSLLDAFVKEGKTNIFKEEKINLKSKITGYMDHPENITKASLNPSVVMMSDSKLKESLINLIDENFKDEYKDLIYEGLCLLVGFNGKGEKYLTNPNQYVITVKDKKSINLYKDNIKKYYDSKESSNLLYLTDRNQMPFYLTINSDVTQARQFTFVFPLVFFLVAILVILTTISQMVLKDRMLIGTLKAIGVSKKMILSHYLLITSSLVLISIIIGSIIGPNIIPNILGKKYLIIYKLPTPTYQFPTLYAILSGLAFIFVSILVTYILCRKEISLNPSESMRPAPVKMKLVNNEKYHKTKFFSIKMAFRNIFIKKYKSIMTVIGIMGCTALLICGFGIEDTINNGIKHDQERFFISDISATFNTNKKEESIYTDLNNIDGIDYYETFYQASTNLFLDNSNQATSLLYIIDDNSNNYKVDFGIDEVALSKKVATKLNAKVGDNITFTINGVRFSSKIGVINETFYKNGLAIHKSNQAIKSWNQEYSGLFINVKNNYNFEDIKNELSKLNYMGEITTTNDFNLKIKNVMGGIFVMTNAVKIFAILLGIVVLYNLTLLNFKEKTRDIATLKVLGFKKHEILSSLLIESLFLTLIGVTIGFIIGYPFLLTVLGTNKVELVDYLYKIKFITYINAFILTFGVAVVINLILSFRIKYVKMIESLKSVE